MWRPGHGEVWYAGQNLGIAGRLDPASGEIEHISLGKKSAPHGVIVGPDGAPWFTDGGQKLPPTQGRCMYLRRLLVLVFPALSARCWGWSGCSGSVGEGLSKPDSARAKGLRLAAESENLSAVFLSG